MQEPIHKRRTEELLVSVGRLLELLRDAKFEAAHPRNIAKVKGAEHWSNRAIENVTADLVKLKTALLQKNPTALTYSAGEFAVLGRYVNDYDYSWFSGHVELAALVTTISDTASPIVTAIDVFDAANLEEVRRALA